MRDKSEIGLEESPEHWSRFDIIFVSLVTAFIFLQLFIIPFTPVYVEGDQLLPVSNAMRILDGEVMYRDFFHFAPPGTELYYAGLFSIFGIKVWVLNSTVLLLAVAQLFLILAFSKELFRGFYVYLPTLLYFVIGFRPFGIDGSYRLFSVIFVLLGAYVTSRNRSPRFLILSGSLCGFASFFVQTRGVLGIGAIGIFLLWLHWKNGIELCSVLSDWFYAGFSFVVAIVVSQFYFVYQAGFDNYYFATVTFLKDYYGNDTLSNTFAYFSDLPDLNSYLNVYGIGGGLFRFLRVAGPTLFIYFTVPSVYLVYFVYRKFRRVDEHVDQKLVLLSILGVVLFLGASAPTALRLYHISIPAMIVCVWLMKRLIANHSIVKGAVCLLALLGVLYSVQRQTTANVTVNLPAGKAAFLSRDVAAKYEWLAGETTPGDPIFEAQHPTFYFPLHLKNPTPFYLVRDNNYTPVSQVEKLMLTLENSSPRFIIWHGGWSKEPSERKAGDNLAPLWDFIKTNYRLKKEFREFGEFTTNSERDIEIWERNG